MTIRFEQVEQRRLHLQDGLDAEKTLSERNELGQFATPSSLALDILRTSIELLPSSESIRFLDPAFGTGAFYSALLRTISSERIEQAKGFEIDPHYGIAASKLWQNTSLQLEFMDFSKAARPTKKSEKANLLVCNPPYVRHHHLALAEKGRLQKLAWETTGQKLNGLAGLYCYFLLIADAWLDDGGIACWLVPSEVLDVNYGRQVKQYLIERVTLLRIHHFRPENVQFKDALVSSVAIWFRKQRPPEDHTVEFSFGDSITSSEATKQIKRQNLDATKKWTFFNRNSDAYSHPTHSQLSGTQLSDLFTIKRGIATGANEFFILNKLQIQERNIPLQFLKPILPSPRSLTSNEVLANSDGSPQLDAPLFLLNCSLPEKVLQCDFPSLWEYLQKGIALGIADRYLCSHRSPWYSQEQRPSAPLICTYMGRQTLERNNRPFRFILNYSNAIAANVYLLLYPKPEIASLFSSDPSVLQRLWQHLNSLSAEQLISEGRTYGGKLHKLEPKELANVRIDNLADIHFYRQKHEQMRLLEKGVNYSAHSKNDESI